MFRPLALCVLALLLLGTAASTAQAQNSGIFEDVGCGTRHLQKSFTIDNNTRLELRVRHWPGRWGQTTVTNSAGSEVWSFRQSYAWIAGEYTVHSPELGPGTYRVDYWADNLAQLPSFCSADLGFAD